MKRRRRTLKKEVAWSGVGLHSGERCCVEVHPSLEEGLFFEFEGTPHPLKEAQTGAGTRRTTLLWEDGFSLETVEHLLAALYGLGIDDALLRIEGPEVPMLDGSAFPFVEGIQRAGIEEKDSWVVPFAIYAPVVLEGPKGEMLVASPASSGLRMTYIVDYPGTAVGAEIWDGIVDEGSFTSTLSRARTFGFLEEVEKLHEKGLALGGSLENALVIGPEGPINPEGYRFEKECAAHKALDLLGDLALLGLPLEGHILALRAGHALHTAFVERLARIFGI